MRVLILGGTSEARTLAGLLDGVDGVQVISSLAGRVANPALPAGQVRIGGFGGPDGLAAWLVEAGVDAVIDATHPFAARITASAAAATGAVGLPLLGLRRPGWLERPGQEWHRVGAIAGAAELLRRGLPAGSRASRVFLTSGRRDLAAFAGLDHCWFLIRAVDAPEVALPPRSEVVLDRGPYTVAGELALMREHRIEVLVTKDSGGELTRAKLTAAAELGVAVIMVNRPPYPLAACVDSAPAAAEWLLRLAAGSATSPVGRQLGRSTSL